jgi:4-amino-4-deoxy-L-arabinose transferase-like glycosyltransferase
MLIYVRIYFTIMLLLAPVNLLSLDSYYYWEWSRHLDWSYYDGAPMIAYLIRLSTWIFGDTFFALSLVGIACSALTCTILYHTARRFLSKPASGIATALWLFSPLVTMNLLKQTTYDNPLTVFWTLTLYFAVRFTQTRETKSLYALGASAGLLLLSKYTGVVLLFGLFIFFIITPYRTMFKKTHVYLAVCLMLLIFSPVLIWNYQHEWISFTYQLTTHQLKHTLFAIQHIFKVGIVNILPALNFMLIPPLLCWIHRQSIRQKKHHWIVLLCQVVGTTFLCFYLLAAGKTAIRAYWLSPYLISSALLAGYLYQIEDYRRWLKGLCMVYGIVSLAIMVNNSYLWNITAQEKFIYYQLIQQFNKDYPQRPDLFLTSGWFEARMMFFLTEHPQVFTLGCGTDENQYGLWSRAIQEKIKQHTLKDALYIGKYDRLDCLTPLFNHCERLPTSSLQQHHRTHTLYVYRCFNI